MIRSTSFFLCGLFVMLFMNRCANPIAPEGGRKDLTPPKVVECIPPALTLNFNQKEIRITFDEFIQLKDQNTQVTVSPPLLPRTEIKLRGKSILISLNDSLQPNTTYSVNFGEAIADLTESNILHDYSYTFSTGNYIDSLSLTGKIISAFDLTPQKDVYAMLYVNENDTLPLDSLPLHVAPYYMAKTRENGEFSFRNLRDVPYLLFGLKDLNGDYFANPPVEKIAFYDSLVRGIYVKPAGTDTLKEDTLLSDTLNRDTLAKETVVPHDTVRQKDSSLVKKPALPSYTLKLFEESDSIQKILKADMVNEDQVGIVFRFPASKPEYIPLNFALQPGWMAPEINATRDTVYLWMNKTGTDSLYLRILDNDKTLDTANINLRKKDSKKKKNEQGAPVVLRLNLSNNLINNKLNPFTQNPVFTFSYPLSGYNFSRILLVDGKDTVKPKVTFADSVKRKLQINYKWKEDKPYSLIFPDSIFHSMNGRSNDTIITAFRTNSLRDFGSFRITIATKDSSCNYLVQLMDEKEKNYLQKILPAGGTVKFDYILPGKYKIKVVFDLNRNGRWDTGKYSVRLQPEEVRYFPKTIEIRANWDVDENWEL
ncbi:MAG: Ig-like domain-containing protein [Bacteroidetes bacterium]|nr:Ig-like domain-containing protein [Bacteroidota bacterium]